MKVSEEQAYEQWKKELTKTIPTFRKHQKPMSLEKVAEILEEKAKLSTGNEYQDLANDYGGIENLAKETQISPAAISAIIKGTRIPKNPEKRAFRKAKGKLNEKK